MQHAVLALVAQVARGASPEPVLRVPAMESTAKHAAADPRGYMFTYYLHIFCEGRGECIAIPWMTSVIACGMCAYSVMNPRSAGGSGFFLRCEVPPCTAQLISMTLYILHTFDPVGIRVCGSQLDIIS